MRTTLDLEELQPGELLLCRMTNRRLIVFEYAGHAEYKFNPCFVPIEFVEYMRPYAEAFSDECYTREKINPIASRMLQMLAESHTVFTSGVDPVPGVAVTDITPHQPNLTKSCSHGPDFEHWPDFDQPFEPDDWNILEVTQIATSRLKAHTITNWVDLTGEHATRSLRG